MSMGNRLKLLYTDKKFTNISEKCITILNLRYFKLNNLQYSINNIRNVRTNNNKKKYEPK